MPQLLTHNKKNYPSEKTVRNLISRLARLELSRLCNLMVFDIISNITSTGSMNISCFHFFHGCTKEVAEAMLINLERNELIVTHRPWKDVDDFESGSDLLTFSIHPSLIEE